MIGLLIALAPVIAPRPAAVDQCARVDIIIVNRVRSASEVERANLWGEIIVGHTFRSQWWVSFWDVLPVPFGAPVYVNRGWWSPHRVEICPCSEGWAATKFNQTVIAPRLLVIDSPFDWEVRHRQIYQPLWR